MADAIADRNGFSRSELLHHLILYAALVGGTYPLTKRILEAPTEHREKLLEEAMRRAKDDDPVKKQTFWKTVARSAKYMDEDTPDKAAKSLLESLLDD